MTDDEKREALAEMNPDAILFDGLEEALVGFGQQFTKPTLAVYSWEKIIASLVRDGMSEEEAQEHTSFNIEGLWAGENTPIIIHEWCDD